MSLAPEITLICQNHCSSCVLQPAVQLSCKDKTIATPTGDLSHITVVTIVCRETQSTKSANCISSERNPLQQ